MISFTVALNGFIIQVVHTSNYANWHLLQKKLKYLMKTLILAMIIGAISISSAAAQFSYDYTILCDSTERLVKSLSTNYKEQATWTGVDVQDKSRYSLWVNAQAGTWTLLKMTPEVSCILGVGTNSEIMLGDAV